MIQASVSSVVLSALVAGLTYCLYSLYKARYRLDGLPQPPHSFLLGHLGVMGEATQKLPPRTQSVMLFTTIAAKYGLEDIFYLDLWPFLKRPAIVIPNPKLIDQVIVSPSYDKSELSRDSMGEWIVGRTSFVLSDGDLWKRSARIFMPAFAPARIYKMVPTMVEAALAFRSKVGELAGSGESFTMVPLVCSMVFAISTEFIVGSSGSARRQHDVVFSREFMDLTALQAQASADFNPFTRRTLRSKQKTVGKKIEAELVERINERLEALASGEVEISKTSFASHMDLCLLEYAQLGEGKSNIRLFKDLKPQDQAVMITDLKSMFIGGSSNSLDTICYIYMLLSMHPDVLQKVRAEHAEVLGTDHRKIAMTLSESPQKLNDLPYTMAVIHEALRMFSPGQFLRDPPPGATISHNGKTYPLDLGAVTILSHAAQHSPTLFPSPSKFDPSRFLGANEIPSRNNIRLFSRGPRVCPGQNFFFTEAKVALLLVVQDFDFACLDAVPNERPRAEYTDMDLVYGDLAFGEGFFGPNLRDGLRMTVSKRS